MASSEAKFSVGDFVEPAPPQRNFLKRPLKLVNRLWTGGAWWYTLEGLHGMYREDEIRRAEK